MSERRKRKAATTTTTRNDAKKTSSTEEKKKTFAHFFVLALYTTLGLSRMLVFGFRSGISLVAASASRGERCHDTRSRDQ